MLLRTAPRTPSTSHDDPRRRRSRLAILGFVLATMLPMLVLAGLALAGMVDGGALEAMAPVAMLLPGVAAVTIGAALRPAPLASLLRLRPERGWGAAIGWTMVALLLVAALGLATAALAVAAGVAVEGDGWQRVVGAVPAVLATMLVLALGEELGWRGFAQHLLAPWGPVRASLVIAALWSLWHAPSMAVWVVDGSMPIAVAATTLASLLLGGVVLSGLSLLGGSVLPAVVGHAAMNSLVVFATSTVVSGDAASIGLVGLVPWALAAAALVTAGAAVVRATRRST